MARIERELNIVALTPSSVFEQRQHPSIEPERIVFAPKSPVCWINVPSGKVTPVPKKVRFSDFPECSNDEVPEITKEDKKKLWWRSADMIRMKSQVQAEAKEDHGARNYLTAFHRIYNQVVEGRASVSEPEKFLLTVGVSMGHRGTEMWGGSAVGGHRLKRIKWVVDGVLHVQKKCVSGDLKSEHRAEILRLTSEYLTKPSLQLAALLGEADARAASSKHLSRPGTSYEDTNKRHRIDI